jgi:hypothetical protein
MKIRIMTIVLAIVALLLVLIPRISYSQTSETDSPCFYRQADGTIVDLRSICGTGSTTTPLPGGMVRSTPSGGGTVPSNPRNNPAMNITPPNDPGVLYLSGSGASDPATAAASQAENNPQR